MLIWVTPDPDRVKRVIALKRNGTWVEVYLGERLLVHHANWPVLERKGFKKCGNDFSKYVYQDPKEAEESKLRLPTNENRLHVH